MFDFCFLSSMIQMRICFLIKLVSILIVEEDEEITVIQDLDNNGEEKTEEDSPEKRRKSPEPGESHGETFIQTRTYIFLLLSLLDFWRSHTVFFSEPVSTNNKTNEEEKADSQRIDNGTKDASGPSKESSDSNPPEGEERPKGSYGPKITDYTKGIYTETY